MKQYRNTLILVFVFLIAIIVYLLLQQRAASQPAPSDIPSQLVLAQFNAQDVKQMVVEQNGKRATYIQDNQDKWSVQEQPGLSPDQTAITNQVVQLGNLSAERIITGTQQLDPAQYGLGPTALNVTVSLNNGTTYQFVVGDKLKIEASYYLKKANDPTIYTVTAGMVGDLFDLLTPKPAPTPTPTAAK